MSHLPRFLPALVFIAAVAGPLSPAHAAPTVIADPWSRDGDNTAGTSGSAADLPRPVDIVGDRWYLAVDPAAVHQRYLDATNRGDVAAAVAMFAQDAVYQGGSCQPNPCVGQVAIQGDIAGNVASHVSVTRLSAQVDGDTLTWRSEVAADGVRAAGVERIITLGTTQVRAATIVNHHFRFDTSDAQTAVYAAFLVARQPQPALDAQPPVD
jgi:ketosteroid isomerase-like protein